MFLISTGKKGASSTDLSRRLSLRQKTYYSFKRKAMAAMASSGHIKLKGTVDVDEFFVGGYEEGKVGIRKHNAIIKSCIVDILSFICMLLFIEGF